MSFNKDPVSNILNDCLSIVDLCLSNKEIYKNDKAEMMKIIERTYPFFYHEYYKVCVSLVGYNIEEDISKLTYLLEHIYKVQQGEMSKQQLDDIFVKPLNNLYLDPVLFSEKLVKEREEKIKNQK